jgi:hypothetical protein
MSDSNDTNKAVSLRSDDARKLEKAGSNSLTQFNEKNKKEEESTANRGLFLIILTFLLEFTNYC